MDILKEHYKGLRIYQSSCGKFYAKNENNIIISGIEAYRTVKKRINEYSKIVQSAFEYKIIDASFQGIHRKRTIYVNHEQMKSVDEGYHDNLKYPYEYFIENEETLSLCKKAEALEIARKELTRLIRNIYTELSPYSVIALQKNLALANDEAKKEVLSI
jgi:isopropylmalate/homocitrate/citramalate synthase